MNPDEIRTHPTETRLTLEEPTSYGEHAEPVEEAEEAEIGTDQDPESDEDEEEIVEPVAERPKTEISSQREKGSPEISGCRACATDR